jgi:hypothetical protein
MSRRAVALGAVLALAAVFAAGGARAYNLTLYFTYENEPGGLAIVPWYSGGPMDLKAPVFAGSYTVVVADLAGADPSPAFTLTGPGVNLQTTLANGADASDTFSVTLQPGATYTFGDQNGGVGIAGEQVLPGPTATFSVGPPVPTATAPSAGATTTVPATAGVLGTLHLALASSGAPALTENGKRVTSLRAGRYRLAVADSSRARGLTLAEIGGSRLAITTDRTIAFTAGQWSLGSTSGKSVHFTVQPDWA